MVGPESLFSLFASVCVCMYVCLALDNRHGQTIGCLVSLRSFVSREQVVPQPKEKERSFVHSIRRHRRENHS